MKFHITHKTDGIYQAILVDGPSAQIAQNYFTSKHPESRICGIHEACSDDMKPGKPLLVVPEGWTPGPANSVASLTEKIKQAEAKVTAQSSLSPSKAVTNSFEK